VQRKEAGGGRSAKRELQEVSASFDPSKVPFKENEYKKYKGLVKGKREKREPVHLHFCDSFPCG
jgi:hypothetical protein